MGDLLPPRRGEFLTADGQPTLRFITWIESLTTISNTTTDTTDILSSLSPGISANVALEKRVSGLEALLDVSSASLLSNYQLDLPIKVVTADYTTAGDEIVVVNSINPVIITLNPSANRKELVQIVRFGTGGVKVTAAKLINGQFIKTIIRQFTSPRHLFIPEVDSWNTI